MDDVPMTRRRFGEQSLSEPSGTGFDSPSRKACSPESEWTPEELQDLLDEVATAPPTLRERMENWGSD